MRALGRFFDHGDGDPLAASQPAGQVDWPLVREPHHAQAGERELATLEQGNYFGERAILKTEPAMASVRLAAPWSCLLQAVPAV